MLNLQEVIAKYSIYSSPSLQHWKHKTTPNQFFKLENTPQRARRRDTISLRNLFADKKNCLILQTYRQRMHYGRAYRKKITPGRMEQGLSVKLPPVTRQEHTARLSNKTQTIPVCDGGRVFHNTSAIHPFCHRNTRKSNWLRDCLCRMFDAGMVVII